MFIVPTQILDIQNEIGETIIEDEANYIIHFSFYVIEGGENVCVCSTERLGNGLKIRFKNKSGESTKLKIIKIINPHILERNYNCCLPPAFIGNTLTGQKVEPGIPKHIRVTGSTLGYSAGVFNYTYKVTSGSEQVYVINEKIDNISENAVDLTFFNAGNTDTYLDVSTIEENKEVSFSQHPPFQQGISLLQGDRVSVDFNGTDPIREIIINRVNPYGKILSYTFHVEGSDDIYVSGQFYDENENLHVKFFNESEKKIKFQVQGWETIPYL